MTKLWSVEDAEEVLCLVVQETSGSILSDYLPDPGAADLHHLVLELGRG